MNVFIVFSACFCVLASPLTAGFFVRPLTTTQILSLRASTNSDIPKPLAQPPAVEEILAQDDGNGGDVIYSEDEMSDSTTSKSSIAVFDAETKKVLDRWAKRLTTNEDAFGIHKLSGLVYTVTSFAIMGTAASQWLLGRQELFANLPAYMEPLMYLFCLANLTMCLASIRMAWLYRQHDLASRNGFIGSAGSSLFSGYFLWWASPFSPDSLTGPLASQLGFGFLTVWNVFFVSDTMIRARDIIDGRRDTTRLQEEENSSFVAEYFRYIAPVAWALPVVAATGYVNTVLHDHTWLMTVFHDILERDGHGIQASVFYNNVLASMAAAYGTFLVTLRDKKLISKRAEWIGIVVLATPTLVWTIDVSARIFPFVLIEQSPVWKHAYLLYDSNILL